MVRFTRWTIILAFSLIVPCQVSGQALVRLDTSIGRDAAIELPRFEIDGAREPISFALQKHEEEGARSISIGDFEKMAEVATRLAVEKPLEFRGALRFMAGERQVSETILATLWVGKNVENQYHAAAVALASEALLEDDSSREAHQSIPILHLNRIYAAEVGQRDAASYSVFAEGQVLDHLSNAEGDGTAFGGSGALGIRRTSRSESVTCRITIAADDADVTGSFGQTVLPRIGGGSLNSASLDLALPLRDDHMHLYGTISTLRWVMEDPAMTAKPIVLGIGALWQRALAATRVGNTELIAQAEVGLSARILTGSGMSREENRSAFLGSSSGAFGGLEVGLQLQFGDLVGGFQYYFYPGPAIDDLTRGAVVAGFSVNADLLSGFNGGT